MASAALPLPRRDPEARARLQEVARGVAPPVLAGERLLPVPGPLGALLPGGGVRRGSVVMLDGPPGSGATSVALQLVAAATAAGEWAAAIDPDGTLGGAAAGEAGVVLDRFAVVRGVPASRWTTVAGALLDGVALVVAELRGRLAAGDARRLTARARERGAVLVAVAGGPAAWPAEAGMRLHVGHGAWPGFGPQSACLASRSTEVHVECRGARRRGRLDALVAVADTPPPSEAIAGRPCGERAERVSSSSERTTRRAVAGIPVEVTSLAVMRRASGASEFVQRANDPEGGGGYPAAE